MRMLDTDVKVFQLAFRRASGTEQFLVRRNRRCRCHPRLVEGEDDLTKLEHRIAGQDDAKVEDGAVVLFVLENQGAFLELGDGLGPRLMVEKKDGRCFARLSACA